MSVSLCRFLLVGINYLSGVLSPKFIVYHLLLLAVSLLAIVTFPRLNGASRTLAILVFIVLLLESAGRVSALLFGSSLPSIHILIPLQLVFYPLLYRQFSEAKKTSPGIFALLTAIPVVLSVLNSLYIQPLFKMPSNSIALLSLLIVLNALVLFYRKLKTPTAQPLLKQPWFWFNSGNLLFFCSTFLIFAFFDQLRVIFGKLPEWQYHVIWVCNLTLYSFYGITLMLFRNESIHQTGH